MEVYLKQYNLLELEVEDAVKVMNTILQEKVVLTGKNNSCYDWEKSGVHAWQKVTKEAAEELLKESIQGGVYENMKEDIERDIERSKYFSSITIT